jgi:hypothetical protein
MNETIIPRIVDELVPSSVLITPSIVRARLQVCLRSRTGNVRIGKEEENAEDRRERSHHKELVLWH